MPVPVGWACPCGLLEGVGVPKPVPLGVPVPVPLPLGDAAGAGGALLVPVLGGVPLPLCAT